MKERYPIGIYDDLDQQQQPMLYLDLLDGNTAVFGTHASGKTAFLKMLLVRLHENPKPECPKRIFILDFGGNIGDYGKLGMVSACFTQSSEENVRRVFKTVRTQIEENERRLKSRQFADLYGTPDGAEIPQIILMIDNLLTLLADERYENYQDELLDFCRNGLSKGLTVVFTSSDTAGGVGRYLRTCTTKIAFDMPTEAYTDIFNTRVTEIMKYPGRGLTEAEHAIREFQSFLPFMNEDEELPEMIEQTASLRTLTLSAFGDVLDSSNVAEYVSGELPDDPDKILIGLDYYDHDPIQIDLKHMHYLAIYGKKGFGKSNLLNVILLEFARKKPDCRFIMLDDGRKQLSDIERLLRAKGSTVEKFTKFDALSDYLFEQGMQMETRSAIGKPIVKMVLDYLQTPTVFVLQGKQLFQGEGKNFVNRFSSISAETADKPIWFVYSDVRKLGIDDRGVETELHNSISAAFLLDDIAEFVSDRGARSVFGERDVKELRREYARCEKGDGYFYDVEADEIRKLKYLKCDDIQKELENLPEPPGPEAPEEAEPIQRQPEPQPAAPVNPQKPESVPQFASGIPKKPESVPQFASGIPKKTESAPQFASGIPKKTESAPQFASGIPKKTESAPQFASGIPKKTESAPQFASGIPKKPESVPQFASGIPKKTESAPQFASGIPKKNESAPQFASGIPKKTESAPQFASGIPKKSEQQTDSAPET